MEQVRASPVKDGHEVVADHLHPELGEVADALLVVFNVLVSGGQTDLDVVVDVHRLHHVHVEAVLVQLALHLGDLVDRPDLTGHFVVQSPHDPRHTGNLLDIGQLDTIVALAVPAECHLHRHMGY